MVLRPGSEEQAAAVFRKWELEFAVIGTITGNGNLTLLRHGQVVADMPVAALVDNVPEYDRPAEIRRAPESHRPIAESTDPMADLMTLLGTPDLCSKRWIWEQYDHMVMADTVQRPGGDAAVVRIHDSDRGLAIATDCTPRYCAADPVEGGRQAVAEVWRNLTATGARPLAITDCMNFGNPERPEIMGQFAGAIEGMAEACRGLDFPVVSGNVSFYNETNGQAVLPTPAIGGIGLLDAIGRMATLALKGPGNALLLIGETKGHLCRSLYQRHIAGHAEGRPPPVDLGAERRAGDFVRPLIAEGAVLACHDISDGGLLVAVAEMAMAGDIGAHIDSDTAAPTGFLFGEDQGRYIIEIGEAAAGGLLEGAEKAGIVARRLGTTGGDGLTVDAFRTISLGKLRQIHEDWLPAYMAGAAG